MALFSLTELYATFLFVNYGMEIEGGLPETANWLDCPQPLYFTHVKEKATVSVPIPYPVKSSVLRWHPVLSRFYPRVQQSMEQKYEVSPKISF